MLNRFSDFGAISDSDQEQDNRKIDKHPPKKATAAKGTGKDPIRKPATAAQIQKKEDNKKKSSRPQKFDQDNQEVDQQQGGEDWNYGGESQKFKGGRGRDVGYPKQGGRGGYRGGHRGGYRGDGEYRGGRGGRGDGEYRGGRGRGDGEYRGGRGGRGDGEYRGGRGRGDGEYRGGRGDGEFRGGRGRGDGEYRGGRGDGEFRGGRGRGGRGRGGLVYKRKGEDGTLIENETKPREGEFQGQQPKYHHYEGNQHDSHYYDRRSATGRGKEQRKGGYGKYGGTGGYQEKNLRNEENQVDNFVQEGEKHFDLPEENKKEANEEGKEETKKQSDKRHFKKKGGKPGDNNERREERFVQEEGQDEITTIDDFFKRQEKIEPDEMPKKGASSQVKKDIVTKGTEYEKQEQHIKADAKKLKVFDGYSMKSGATEVQLGFDDHKWEDRPPVKRGGGRGNNRGGNNRGGYKGGAHKKNFEYGMTEDAFPTLD